MKKIIISSIVTACIMALGCGMYVKEVKSDYEYKLETAAIENEIELNNIMKENKKLTDKCSKLDASLEELYDQVYNVMEGNDYDFTIERGDEIHGYYKTSGEGWFDGHIGHSVTVFK